MGTWHQTTSAAAPASERRCHHRNDVVTALPTGERCQNVFRITWNGARMVPFEWRCEQRLNGVANGASNGVWRTLQMAPPVTLQMVSRTRLKMELQKEPPMAPERRRNGGWGAPWMAPEQRLKMTPEIAPKRHLDHPKQPRYSVICVLKGIFGEDGTNSDTNCYISLISIITKTYAGYIYQFI